MQAHARTGADAGPLGTEPAPARGAVLACSDNACCAIMAASFQPASVACSSRQCCAPKVRGAHLDTATVPRSWSMRASAMRLPMACTTAASTSPAPRPSAACSHGGAAPGRHARCHATGWSATTAQQLPAPAQNRTGKQARRRGRRVDPAGGRVSVVLASPHLDLVKSDLRRAMRQAHEGEDAHLGQRVVRADAGSSQGCGALRAAGKCLVVLRAGAAAQREEGEGEPGCASRQLGGAPLQGRPLQVGPPTRRPGSPRSARAGPE